MTQAARRFSGARSPALAAAVSAVLAGAAGSAHAQSTASLDEVIVTATKRSERLQDVPESISAFDTKAIAMRGLQQMGDYAKLIPGMSISEREPGATTIVFRGVASSGLQFGAVSSAALYLDDQPITQSGRNPDPRLIDIERIEALRGPQGTLYGASSQSGTLRVITNKPDPAAFDSWAEAQVSNTSSGGTGYDVSAMLNIPLAADRIALRLVGFTAEDAGFIDNVLGDSKGTTSPGNCPGGCPGFTNANVVKKDVNKTTTSGGRAALRWDITDNVNATLGAIFQDVAADGHGDINLGVGDLNQVRFEKESLDDQWYQVALTVNASLPFGDASLTASYFDRDFRYEGDATDYEFRFNDNFVNCVPSAYYDCTSPVYDFGGDPRGFATNHESARITTIEARLASKTDSGSRWGWLVGAFYSQERGHTNFDSFIRDYQDTGSFAYFYSLQPTYDPGNPLAPTERWFLGRYDTELDQVAAFGELSFDITENFTITAGGRWFDYDRKFTQHQEQPEGFLGFSLLDDSRKNSETGSVAKLNFNYKFDNDRLVYATYSEGFRVGGSNPLKAASLLPRDFKSDELQNFELGAKTEWLENRVRLNIAAYYMKWKDFAVQIEDPQPRVFQLAYVNLPTAVIPGIEAEFAFTFNEEWQIDGSLAWNDAKIDQATTLTLTDSTGTDFSFTVSDGARLPLTPDWSATLGLEYRSAASSLLNAHPFARFDIAYVGESVNSLEGIESVVSGNPVAVQPAYQTGDLRMGLEGENWSASLFVNNVWDERADLFLSNRWATQRQSVNRPRTIGVQFRYDF
jgi:outer membrane receptor protein involved in Fe transport